MPEVMLIWDSATSSARPATPADFGGSGTGGSAAADGATAPTTTQQVGGKDGSGNLQSLLVDTSGNVAGVGGTSDAAATAGGTGSLNAKQRLMTSQLDALNAALVGTEYETIAASQTDQVLGATGAAGDLLRGLLIVPATVAAGTISIKDGAGSAINVFVTGTLPSLEPFWLPLGIRSAAGAWSVTTGANVSVIACGNFT